MTNTVKINQIDRVAIAVRHMPGCVIRDICEALDVSASTACNFLRSLTRKGIITRKHNGTQYVYTAAEGANIPDVVLPFMLEKPKDPEQLQAVEALAQELELKGFWRRAATQYTSAMNMACNSNEMLRLCQRRDACYRRAARRA